MKIFISWSGQRSHAVAELLNDWIKCVLQASNPWISSSGIAPGSLWFTEIINELRDTSVGIICITQENKDRPWLLFEAGAIAKGLATSRVCTLLIDLKSSDLKDPLAQFNHTQTDRDSMWKLVRMLNNALDIGKLEERTLAQVFDTYWPQFEEKFAKALEDNQPTEKIKPRSNDSMLEEILQSTRSLNARVSQIESGSSGSPIAAARPLAIESKESYNMQILNLIWDSARSKDMTPEVKELINRLKPGKKLGHFIIRAPEEPNSQVLREMDKFLLEHLGDKNYSLSFEFG